MAQKSFLFATVTVMVFGCGYGQIKPDSLPPSAHYKVDHRVYKKMILPAALISFGFMIKEKGSSMNITLNPINEPDEGFNAFLKPVNIARFAPAIMVYGLNFSGVKGWHNFMDRSLIYITSQALNAAMVYTLKHRVKELRPDSSNFLSFPLGHAAFSFSAAQFFYREYRDKNFWLSLSTYPIAFFAAANRMAHNKHWFADVVAGAGIGILSTEMAYWLFPKMKKLWNNNKTETQALVLPYFDAGRLGLTVGLQF